MKTTSLFRFGLVIYSLLAVIEPARSASVAQQAYLKASNTGANDYFGSSVAVWGNTMVVGAPYEDSNATGVNGDRSNNATPDSGAAYVFVRNGTTWTQQAYLKASNTGAGDYFGDSVAVSADTVVVGAWRESSDATGVNGDGSNNRSTRSGAEYVFVRNGTNWTQQAYLKASNTRGALPMDVHGDYFGSSVAVSGDTVVVGATGENSNATGVNGDQNDDSASFSGAAYVFVRNGTNWNQEAYLKPTNPGPYQYFGVSVAVQGDTLVVGSEADDIVNNSGAAHVFVRSGTTWSEQAYLKASNPGDGAYFGRSIALSGETLVVGALGESSNAAGVNGDQSDNNAPGSGAAYVFVRSGATWTQQAYLKASNTGAGDQFGWSAAASGDTVVVGAWQESSNATGVNGNQSDNSATHSGAAYIFVRSGTNWSQQAYLKASNTGAGDCFGYSVALSSNTVAIGAGSSFGSEDSNATGVNGDQSNNSATDSGAAYVFTGLGTAATPPYLPALSVIPAGKTVLITWPASVSGAVLETTDTLSPTATWVPVAAAPVTIGDETAVAVDIEGGMKFYRLKKP